MITPVMLDVSKEEDVNTCASNVAKQIEDRKLGGLFGVLQCAGIAFTAPFEYIPMASFKRQMDVNFYGYIYVAKAFLPLLRRYATPERRGRICFVSSGPVPGPGVPFITSYLAAKWAGDAVIQVYAICFLLCLLNCLCFFRVCSLNLACASFLSTALFFLLESSSLHVLLKKETPC